MAALALAAALASLTSAAPTAPDTSLVKRDCACDTIPLILLDLDAKVKVIIANLKVAIGTQVKVNLSVLQPFLVQLKAAIVAATVQLQAIATLDLNVILVLNGVVLSITACAQLLLTVFLDIILVLQICFNAVFILQVSALLLIFVDLSVVIAAFLTLIFQIIIGIQVIFCGLISADIIAFLTLCGLTKILVLIVI